MKRQTVFSSAALVLAFLWSNSFLCPSSQAELKGGCAKVNITPPLGIPLIGSKGRPSDTILDELYAKALVLDDGRSTVAIVSVDLLYTPLEEITQPVRRIIRGKTGISEQNVLVCATHTHSGPEVFTLSKFRPGQRIEAAKLDQAYLQTLIRKIADSVYIAQKKMKKVKIGLAGGILPELLYNRRTKKPDGSVTMAFSVTPEVAATRKIQTGPGGTTVSFATAVPNPDLKFGPVDPAVRVLRIEDANDVLIGSILNFACHPVCIYPSMPTTLSADYPGDATNLVEEIEGGICLFTLGTAGDMVPYQRGLDAHRQIGKALGAEAVRRLQFVPTSEDISVDAIRKDVRFPAKKTSSTEGGDKPDEGNEFVQTEIQIVRIGEIYILGLPGEVLAEVGLEIRKHANIEKLILISLGNDAIGYVCHKEAYDEGGYEPDSATHLAKGAGEIMINEAMDLINQIKQNK